MCCYALRYGQWERIKDLLPGQAHDLEGTDALLSQMQADALDRAFDADERETIDILSLGW